MEKQKSELCLSLNDYTPIELDNLVVNLASGGNVAILEQFKSAVISSREATSAGCYVNLAIDNNMKKSELDGFVGNVNLVENNECVGGAMLYVENGILRFIEYYFWDENEYFMKVF